MLSGADPESVRRAVNVVLALRGRWIAPAEYTVPNVSDTVIKILLGYFHG
jgi:hypothetical protein